VHLEAIGPLGCELLIGPEQRIFFFFFFMTSTQEEGEEIRTSNLCFIRHGQRLSCEGTYGSVKEKIIL
jgi:hypothetical protein